MLTDGAKTIVMHNYDSEIYFSSGEFSSIILMDVNKNDHLQNTCRNPILDMDFY